AKLDLTASEIVLSGSNGEIAVASFKDPLDKDKIAELKTHFNELYGTDANVSTVSPTVGNELVKSAIYALLIAAVGIVIYVWFRFEVAMGVASIVSLVHDAFFIVAVFSLIRFEIDITFIAAILTIIGYSINDTII